MVNDAVLLKTQQRVPWLNKNFPYKKRNSYREVGVERAFFEKVVFGMFECWLWRASTNDLGYGLFGPRRAHRASYEFFYGEIPKGMSVLHRCDVRNCVNPEHLFLGTQADNVRDMMQKKRHRCTPMRGEANPQSKLTAKKVRQIKALKQSGVSQAQIAKLFKVSPMTISRAVTGKAWKLI